jgi:hypothetical protein
MQSSRCSPPDAVLQMQSSRCSPTTTRCLRYGLILNEVTAPIRMHVRWIAASILPTHAMRAVGPGGVHAMPVPAIQAMTLNGLLVESCTQQLF